MGTSKLPSLTPQQPPRFGRLRTELIRFALYGGTVAITLVLLGAGAHDAAVDAAFERGRLSGFTEADTSLKDRLVENQELINSTCKSWWFELTHKDRKIK